MDDEDLLPPTLYDLAALPQKLSDTRKQQVIVKLTVYLCFNKSLYQPFFGITYLTGQLAVSTVENIFICLAAI